MLQKLRNRAKSWVAIVIIFFLALSFALWGVQSYLGHHTADAKVATVNGKAITGKRLKRAYKIAEYKWRISHRLALPSSNDRAILKARVLQMLVANEILSGAAQRAHLTVSKQQAALWLHDFPIFQQDGKFSWSRYQNFIDNFASGSEVTLLKNVQEDLVNAQFYSAFSDSDFILPHEIKRIEQIVNQKRSVDYLLLEKTSKQPPISKQQISDYYQQHQAKFIQPERVKIAYIILSSEEVQKHVNVTEQDITQAYYQHTSLFTKPARYQVIYWDDQASKWTSPKWIVLNQLEKIDQQNLLELSSGKTFTLSAKHPYKKLKLLKIKSQQVIPLKKAHLKAKLLAKQKKLQQNWDNLSQKLAELTYMHPKELKTAASQLGLRLQTSDYFTREGNKDGITAIKSVLQASFDPETLDKGNNSDVITLPDQHLLVLRILAHQKSNIQAQKQVHDIILKQLQATKQREQTQILARQIMSSKYSALKKILKQHRLIWQHRQLERQDTFMSPVVVEQIFSLSPRKPWHGMWLDNNRYLLVRLRHIQTAKASIEPGKIPKSFKSKWHLPTAYGEVAALLYERRLWQKARIVVDPLYHKQQSLQLSNMDQQNKPD